MEVKMDNIKGISKRPVLRGGIRAALVLLLLAVGGMPAVALSLISEITWGGGGTEVTDGAVVAADGSTYLTGFTRSFSGGTARPIIFVVKFAADGSLTWQRTWQGPDSFVGDEARDIAVAPDGSIYVTGNIPGIAGDVVLLK